jgi:prepilin-type processing-associated H-X9-DG protein
MHNQQLGANMLMPDGHYNIKKEERERFPSFFMEIPQQEDLNNLVTNINAHSKLKQQEEEAKQQLNEDANKNKGNKKRKNKLDTQQAEEWA